MWLLRRADCDPPTPGRAVYVRPGLVVRPFRALPGFGNQSPVQSARHVQSLDVISVRVLLAYGHSVMPNARLSTTHFTLEKEIIEEFRANADRASGQNTAFCE